MDRVAGQDYVDIGGGRRGFRDQSAGVGIPGTEVTAAWLNMTQEEMCAFVELNGGALGPGFDRKDLAKAGRAQQVNYVVVGGTGNALTATLNPAVTDWAELLYVPLDLKIALDNTAEDPTFAPNGLAGKVLCRRLGDKIIPYDLRAGMVVRARFDGTKMRLESIADREYARVVDVSPELFVRLDGNDNNDGSANDAAHAFATIDAAIAYGKSRFYLRPGQALNIRLGIPGTYAAPSDIARGGDINIIGNLGAAETYILSGAGIADGGVISAGAGTYLSVIGCTVHNTSTNSSSISAYTGGLVTCQGCNFTKAGGASTGSIFLGNAGSIFLSGTIRVMAGTYASLFQINAGDINMSANFILSGTPVFTNATAVATTTGRISGRPGVGFIGGATGVRYAAILNGVINTLGSGAAFFPGDTAGYVNTGGQYA